MSIPGSEGSNQATLYLSLPRGTHLREPQGGTGAQDSLRRVLEGAEVACGLLSPYYAAGVPDAWTEWVLCEIFRLSASDSVLF